MSEKTEEPKKQKRSPRHSGLPVEDHGGYRIRWIGADGERHSQNFPINAYKQAVAELVRRKAEAQAVRDGRAPSPQDVPTFDEFIEKYWLPNRNKPKRSPKDDQSIIHKHLSPAFGNLRLDMINTAKADELKGRLAKDELAPKTISNIITLMISILRYAHELDLLFRVPVIKKPKVVQQDYSYLHEDEINRLLKTAREYSTDAVKTAKRKKIPAAEAVMYPLIAAAFFTGARIGELFALEWNDIDFDKKLITIKASFDKPTKSGTIRHVPLLDPLAPILKEWQLACPKGVLVFPTVLGTMHKPSPRIIKESFPAILDKAELPKIRWHDLRHSFASRWAAAGGDLYQLEKILGHASGEMTRRYSHLSPKVFDGVHDIFGDKPPAMDGIVLKINKSRKEKR